MCWYACENDTQRLERIFCHSREDEGFVSVYRAGQNGEWLKKHLLQKQEVFDVVIS